MSETRFGVERIHHTVLEGVLSGNELRSKDGSTWICSAASSGATPREAAVNMTAKLVEELDIAIAHAERLAIELRAVIPLTNATPTKP